ncbi:serine hydrolase [Pedobacter sp. P351]|uniref:serine hydrolase domain-containing protein n=1 Tax=Pedobacter superstes TaxID=3133441 RepID=UPI0030AC1598
MKGNFKEKKVRFHSLYYAVFLLILVLGGFDNPINEKEILAQLVKQNDFQRSTVLLNNQLRTIPLKDLASRRIASINTGVSNSAEFDNMLRNYDAISSFNFENLRLDALNSFTTLVIQVNPETLFKPEVFSFIQEVQKNKEVIIAGFGNSTALQRLEEFNMPVIWNPEQSAFSATYTAQVIFGGIAAEGRLALNISPKYMAGTGYFTEKSRLKYSLPEEVGIQSSKLSAIDDIVEEAIREHATPSAVVLVVKDGNVIFNKAYGSHTYDGNNPTQVNDIYDLASVTKVAATTMATMKLYEKEKINLNANLGTYLADVRNTNKNEIPVKDVLLHQAGFVNLDFFSDLRSGDHTSDSSFFYPVKAADHYFIRRNYYQDVMWPKMLRTPLPTRGRYVYSDISMYVMKEIIERQAEKTLDKFVLDEFYKPLGMRTAGFNPRRRFDADQIVPTERDTYFRKTLLQGYVHDSGASLVDGISGHAGLFASANDLAILNQMLLNGGTYGGVQYFKPETVELFTARQSNVSRRGLGFDRAEAGGGYPSRLASSSTFGHTGYTGTCVWTDPKEKLVYVFLSNRVYPSASNKLNSLRIRPRIQDAIYAAIAEGNGSFASAVN